MTCASPPSWAAASREGRGGFVRLVGASARAAVSRKLNTGAGDSRASPVGCVRFLDPAAGARPAECTIGPPGAPAPAVRVVGCGGVEGLLGPGFLGCVDPCCVPYSGGVWMSLMHDSTSPKLILQKIRQEVLARGLGPYCSVAGREQRVDCLRVTNTSTIVCRAYEQTQEGVNGSWGGHSAADWALCLSRVWARERAPCLQRRLMQK